MLLHINISIEPIIVTKYVVIIINMIINIVIKPMITKYYYTKHCYLIGRGAEDS